MNVDHERRQPGRLRFPKIDVALLSTVSGVGYLRLVGVGTCIIAFGGAAFWAQTVNPVTHRRRIDRMTSMVWSGFSECQNVALFSARPCGESERQGSPG